VLLGTIAAVEAVQTKTPPPAIVPVATILPTQCSAAVGLRGQTQSCSAQTLLV